MTSDIFDKRIVALVPMRHQSDRVPGKNFRELAGSPLFAYILRSLEKVEQISEIVVDTDSQDIRDGISELFPQVTLINRPEHLRKGEIPMNEILLHDSSVVKADFYLQSHSTNPLLEPETIQQAIVAFLEAIPQKDSLFSVTELHTRLYDSDAKAINHDPKELLRTQDLPPIYEENSCLYMFSRESLEKQGHRIGKRPVMHVIPAEQALDIDEESDFLMAESILQRRRAND